jgi:hypothetical protein
MAITEVQSVSAGNAVSGTTATATLAAAPTTGNLLVAVVSADTHSAGDVTISMVGTGWATAQQKLGASNWARQAVFYKTAGASESATIQATLTAARYWAISVVEAHSSVAGGWVLDKTANNSGSGGASGTSGTTATTTAGDEYLAAAFTISPYTATMSAPTNSFAIKEQVTSGAGTAHALLTRIVTATATYSTGGTFSAIGLYIATIQTFKVATTTVTPGAVTLSGAGRLTAHAYYATPTLSFLAAFGYTSTDPAPVWTDISSYAREFVWQRGRQNELNQIQAGTATLTINDPRSYFDPDNTASPFYPNVKPGLPVRAILFVGAAAYPLFYGFAERLPRTDRVTSVYTRRQIDLTDGLALLAYAGLGDDTYPAQTSDQRVAAVLNNIGWPTTRRTIGTGSETLQAVAYPADDTTTALTHLQALDASEDGLVYVDASNNVVFVGRAALASAPYTVSSAIFKDTA